MVPKMARILCVHPDVRELKFLLKLIGSLTTSYKSLIDNVELRNSDISHRSALRKIEESKDGDLILFLCHGGSDYIRSGYDLSMDQESSEKEYFVSVKNISLLKEKRIICLSCNSNEKLAEMAIEAGAKVFIGFGDILFDEKKSFSADSGIKNTVVNNSKGEMRSILFEALRYSIDNRITYYGFVNYLKYFANRRCDALLEGKYRNKNLRVANFLDEFKHGIRLLGDGNIKFDF
jgi:hypothetical protein